MGNALSHHMFEDDAEDVTVTELAMSKRKQHAPEFKASPNRPRFSQRALHLQRRGDRRDRPKAAVGHESNILRLQPALLTFAQVHIY